MNTENFEIGKLDGTNYVARKFKMRLLLVHKYLWSFVQGSVSDNEKSNKALALIGLSVNDAQILHIKDCLSAKEAWDKLSKMYENTGIANKMHLQEDLMMTKMGESDSAQEHIEKMRRIMGKLGTLGLAFSDDQHKI